MKRKLGLILVGLLVFVNSVSAASFWDFNFLDMPINFLALKDVSLWVAILTWGIVFMLIYKLVSKMHLFKGDNKNSAILALLISLASMVGSPVAVWMMATVALSPFIIFIMFILMFLWTAISFAHKWGADAHTRMMQTNKDWSKDKRFYRKEQKQAQKELEDLKEVLKQIKEAKKHKDTPDYDSLLRDAISHLEHVRDQIINSIKLERKRFKTEKEGAVEELKDLARKIKADIDDALDALHNKRPEDAEGELKRAEKKLKRWKKESKKLLKEGRKEVGLLEEGKGDISEVINKAKQEYADMLKNLEEGKYDQEQAVGWQEKIWGEFSRDLSKLGYDNSQIKETWEKEIWSQGHVEGAVEEGKQKQEPQKLLEAGNLDESIKPYKDQYAEVIEKVKSGEYTQEQAQDWQQKIWGEFFKDFRKQGYNDNQIKEFWQKEIWSQGHEEMSKAENQQLEMREKWQKLMQKKIKKIDPIFKVDLVKHPKKAKNYIRDMRKDIDQDMMDAATSIGQDGNLNSYIAQFDQILDFFEHTKKPHEADENDWKSIMNVATAYKNFVLALRDNL